MTERIYNVPTGPKQPKLDFTRLVIDQEMRRKPIERRSTKDFFFVYMAQRSSLGGTDGYQVRPPHSWVLWGPQHHHYYGSQAGPWLHSCFHVRGPRAEQIFEVLPLNEVGQVSNPAALQQSLHGLFEIISQQQVPDEQCLAASLRLIVQLCLQAPEQHVDADMHRIWRYLQNNFEQQHSLESLAGYMHCSASSLRQRFKACFGLSIMEHLLKLRMREAHYLLQQPDYSISDISRRVGYTDSAYFSRLIKKYYGLSPRALRQSFLKAD